MTTTKRLSLTALVCTAFAASAGAQGVATFGAVEAAGFGESSALLGASISNGREGISPVATISGQTYRFRSGDGKFNQAYAVSPALGLQYNSGHSILMGAVGYSFVSTDNLSATTQQVGLETGTENSVFVTGQYNYWGDGNSDVQAIAAYAIEPAYVWSRFRAARRMGISPLFFGGEVVAQGTSGNDRTVTSTSAQGTVVSTRTVRDPSSYRFNVGPTVQYRYTENFRVGASAGLRTGGTPSASSGYARLEFLALTNLGKM